MGKKRRTAIRAEEGLESLNETDDMLEQIRRLEEEKKRMEDKIRHI